MEWEAKLIYGAKGWQAVKCTCCVKSHGVCVVLLCEPSTHTCTHARGGLNCPLANTFALEDKGLVYCVFSPKCNHMLSHKTLRPPAATTTTEFVGCVCGKSDRSPSKLE